MKIKVMKSEILEAAIPSVGFASNKNTIASTEGILLNTVSDKECELTAYDLEKGMKTTVTCIVEESGAGIINCQRFIQIIKAMPDGLLTIEINESNLKAKISAGTSEFELYALSASDFPDLPELRGDRGFKIRQDALRAIIQKTQFAIAVNSVKPELNGLDLKVEDGVLSAVSCDGSRLSVVTETDPMESVGTSELAFDVIIPGKSVSELMRFISDSDKEMEIYVARKHIIFFIGRFVLFTRRIDAQYIDYDRFIPKAPKIFVTLDTVDLLSALERALLVTEERRQGQIPSPVICTVKEGQLTIASSSVTGRVNDVISVHHEGEDIEIGFNCRFLYDAIKVCDCERIKLCLTSPLMSMTVEEAGENPSKFLLLILPVRLNG
ncbi:MAG: DNA polymerase III subunit beta [Clostridia bacterium]|nr:DNA polymerase III subunit beta [Clostridia bacterium]